MVSRYRSCPGVGDDIPVIWMCGEGKELAGVLPDRWIHGPEGELVPIDPCTDAGGTTTGLGAEGDREVLVVGGELYRCLDAT